MLNCQILTEKLLQTKHLLVENELNNLKTFDSSYLIGKSFWKGWCTKLFIVSTNNQVF